MLSDAVRLMLACPCCRGELSQPEAARLVCSKCQQPFAAEDGVPILVAGVGPTAGEVKDYYERLLVEEDYGFDASQLRGNAKIENEFSHEMFIWTWEQAVNDWLPGKTVLEIGSGNGWMADRLAHRAEQYIGLDIALLAQIRNQRQHAACGCQFFMADAVNLPFRDGVFDVVLSSETIEHIERPEHMVAEIGRVIREGGHVCISTPNPLIVLHPTFLPRLLLNPIGWMKRLRRQANWSRDPYDRWIPHWILIKWLRANGFEVTGFKTRQYAYPRSLLYSLTPPFLYRHLIKATEHLGKIPGLHMLGVRYFVTATRRSGTGIPGIGSL